MRIADFRLQIADWGFGISNLISQISDSQFRTLNPESRIPSSRSSLTRRRGVSLLEVLFAILVTTIGLLGAVAVLPVASMQAQKGRMNDAMAVAGLSAVHEFDTRGMRQTSRWMAWDSTNNRYSSIPLGPFTQVPLVNSAANPQYGRSFCIDPRFIAANPTSPNSGTASFFPYTASTSEPRMLRITLFSGLRDSSNNMLPMGSTQADHIFQLADDLTYERPEDDRTLNARQIFDSFPSDATKASKRQSDGHMSWMATLVPKLERHAAPSLDTYVLSIVMFHDRPAGLSLSEVDPLRERIVELETMASGSPVPGVSGGEVQLKSGTEAALKLRPNDWIMLSGFVSHGGGGPSIPVFKWYRVSDCDPEVEFDGTTYTRYATLIGEDWNTAVPLTTLRATIVDGVVGVYEKTIRLEPGGP